MHAVARLRELASRGSLAVQVRGAAAAAAAADTAIPDTTTSVINSSNNDDTSAAEAVTDGAPLSSSAKAPPPQPRVARVKQPSKPLSASAPPTPPPPSRPALPRVIVVQSRRPWVFQSIPCRSFKLARAHVRALGMKSEVDFAAWAISPDRPLDIPRNPLLKYGRSWTTWQDFLGAPSLHALPPHLSQAGHMELGAALQVVRPLRLPDARAYEQWRTAGDGSRLPRAGALPVQPDVTYAHAGWVNWEHFLGVGRERDGATEGAADGQAAR